MVRPARKRKEPKRPIEETQPDTGNSIQPNTRETLVRKRKTQPKQNDNGSGKKADVLYRMLRQTIGTLSAKINKLTEEVNEAKLSMETGNRINETSEISTNDVTQANEEILISDSSSIGRGLERGVATQTLTENEHRNIIYNIQNVNIEKPKFGDGKGTHPVTFLEDLDAYIKKTSSANNILDKILECLTGNARDWARIYKARWSNLEDFKMDFLATYWGEKEQNELRRTIVQGNWDQEANPSMLDYYLALVGKAQMLTYKLPEKQMITDLVRHFPKNVQQGWITSKIDSIIGTAEYLRSMDDINKQERRRFPNLNKTNSTNKSGEKRQTEFAGNYQRWKKPRVNFVNAADQHPEPEVEVVNEVALN